MEEQGDAALKGYIFTGRVHPERYGFGLSGLPDVVIPHRDGSRSYFRFQLSWSQLVVQVMTNNDSSMADMKNRVNRQARIALDALGHVSAQALDLEIVSCVDPSGQAHVFDTAFYSLRDKEGPERDQHEHMMLNLLIAQARVSPNIRMALSDLRNAIREPLDTCVNCYRAVESIRHEYLGEGPDSDSARRQSWARLREATGTKESELLWLRGLARPRRHGMPVDLSNEDRERALRMARRVLEQHCIAAQPAAQEQDTPGAPAVHH